MNAYTKRTTFAAMRYFLRFFIILIFRWNEHRLY